jgi:hypothetical protein
MKIIRIAQDSNDPLNGKTNEQARKFVRNLILPLTTGIFNDDYWAGPQKILLREVRKPRHLKCRG